jgi:Spy/CpxP family protein refolding chaperone
MKRSTYAMLAAVVAGGLIGLGSVAQAQEAPKPAAKANTNAPAARAPMDRTEYWGRLLELKPEQKDKLRPILDEEAKKYAELRTQKELTQQDRAAKAKEIREAISAKVKPILTPEQWEKYSKRFQPRVMPGARTNAVPGAKPATQPTPAK